VEGKVSKHPKRNSPKGGSLEADQKKPNLNIKPQKNLLLETHVKGVQHCKRKTLGEPETHLYGFMGKLRRLPVYSYLLLEEWKTCPNKEKPQSLSCQM